MDLTLVMDGHQVWLPAAALLGMGVGLVAGMFGVGGGFLLVPMLIVILDVPLTQAVGAALCQSVAIGLGALLRYRHMGHAETRFDVLLLGGSVFGVDAGARLLASLEGSGETVVLGHTFPLVQLVVTALYAALFLTAAALLWWKPTAAAEAQIRPGPLARLPVPPHTYLPGVGINVSGIVVGAIGFGNGLLAGLIGIGGGIVLVPVMLYGFGFNIRRAAGTGIVVVLAVAIIGTVQHARLGHVHLGLAATLMIGSALAAQVGAGLTRSLDPTILRKALAVVMLLTLLSMFYKLFG